MKEVTKISILEELAELEDAVRKSDGEREAAGVAMAAAHLRKILGEKEGFLLTE